MLSFYSNQHINIVLLFVPAMAIFSHSSVQKGLTISCTLKKLTGNISPGARITCSLNRSLDNCERAVWLYSNCGTIGTCTAHKCDPSRVRKNGITTLSVSNEKYILYTLNLSDSEYFFFTINDSCHGLIQRKIVSMNDTVKDSCTSQHVFRSPCGAESVDDLTRDCVTEIVTEDITKEISEEHVVTDINIIRTRSRLHSEEFVFSGKTKLITEKETVSYIMSSISNPISYQDLTTSKSPSSTDIANSQQILIQMMFAVIIVVSVLLLVSRFYTCIVQDGNICRVCTKAHSFQPSENVYQIYETIQNNENIEAIAMASLRTPSLPRSVVHSIETGSVGRLMSVEVNLNGSDVDVKEEKPPVPPRDDSEPKNDSQEDKTIDSKSDVESQVQNRSDSTTDIVAPSERDSQKDVDDPQMSLNLDRNLETSVNFDRDVFNDLDACFKNDMDTNEFVREPGLEDSPSELEKRKFDPSIDELFDSPQYDTLRSKKRK